MSIALFIVGIAGRTGLFRAGLATRLRGTDCEPPCLSGRSRCACRLLSTLCGKGDNVTCGLECSFGGLDRFSICPSTVVPLKAMCSSGIGLNFMTPRAGATPSESAMKVCSSAALRLLVVGSN